MNFPAIKKLISKMIYTHSLDSRRCSTEENIVYFSKDNFFTEWDEKPRQYICNDLDELKEDIKNGNITCDDILDHNPYMFHQFGRTLEKLEDMYGRRKYRDFMTTCTWIYGEASTGKRETAFKEYEYENYYILNTSDDGWWEGYNGHDVVIINKFRGEIIYKTLLELIDKYPYTVKQRNKAPVPFMTKHIIITSSLHPRDIYTDLNHKDNLSQLLRRIKIVQTFKNEETLNKEFMKKIFNVFKKNWYLKKYED